jgi:hypothetical protein
MELSRIGSPMRKEVERTETKTKKETAYFCDICGKQFSSMYRQPTCTICKRDVCRDCSIRSDSAVVEYYDSDYSSTYCNICRGINEFREQLSNLSSKYDDDRDAIYAKWKEASLNKST